MPSNKEIAEEIWLHVNSPELLDKIVGDQIARFQREARFDDLADFQNERKEIDDAVERYMSSPVFEEYRQTFSEADTRESPEVEQAVSEMARELRQMSVKDREQHANQISSDIEELDQALEQDIHREEQQHE